MARNEPREGFLVAQNNLIMVKSVLYELQATK
jgi:hypothetical protein